MYQDRDQVVLACPLPALGLEPGDVGVVVHVHPARAAFVVEFMSHRWPHHRRRDLADQPA